MSLRLGVCLEPERWRWALVDVRGHATRVVRGGSVAPEDWEGIARDSGGAASVGLALPDREVTVRRIRVGHPPSSSDGLRQLARWRLKDDLPFDIAAIDARIEAGHALVLAGDRERVRAHETSARGLGPVEHVTSAGLAVLGLLPIPAEGTVTVSLGSSHTRARYEGGGLTGLQLLDGVPPASEVGTHVLLDGGPMPSGLQLEWADDLAEADRVRLLPAVGAVLDALRLNLATHPPMPPAARWIAWSAASVAFAAAGAALIAAVHTSHSVSVERAALDALSSPPALVEAPQPTPELAALAAVATSAPPAWSSLFASLERDFPEAAHLEGVEWTAGTLRLQVAARDAGSLDAVRDALSNHGAVRPISQSGGAGNLRAELALEAAP